MRGPMTETYRGLQVASKNPMERWLDTVTECLHNKSQFNGEYAGELRCTFEDGAGTGARLLRKVYASWLQDNGYDWKITEASFAIKLSGPANGCAAGPCPWVRKVKASRVLYHFDRAMMIKRVYGADAIRGGVRATVS